jgi:hypothetical protein
MERYEVRVVEMRDVIKEIDSLWNRLQSDELLKEDCEDAGVDLSKLAGMSRAGVIDIKAPGHGISGAELFDVSIVSAISGAHVVAYDLWKRVILPRLEKRFGKGAIKEKPAAKQARAGQQDAATSSNEANRRKITAKKAPALKAGSSEKSKRSRKSKAARKSKSSKKSKGR